MIGVVVRQDHAAEAPALTHRGAHALHMPLERRTGVDHVRGLAPDEVGVRARQRQWAPIVRAHAQDVELAQQLLRVAEARHRDHRPEYLPLDHLVVLLEARDYGRFEVEAGSAGLAATRDDLRALWPASEKALDAVELALGVDRPERRVRRERVPD